MTKQSINQKFSNWILIGLASVGLLLAGCAPSDLPTISPKEAAAMFSEQKAIIVDVREDNEWNEGHIAGAIHIPLAQVASRLSELTQYKDSNVVVQCRSGKRSAKAASTLQAAGFTKVYNLTGGIIAWDKDGLKTTK
ncbi:rhodanese-like domain-containing protein [Methylotenera sp.]|jgi:rhodanese-related sulfurtransferase|uniref:rhodanese-like domain-containing protein n=1 Tax=Methylotenera sp. TaxID=2051956 RepID=UPI00272169E7|nr:rhodanese-like domain-containing protein [Methylotenera sp.]MDO9204953.1 rhodanese-like domain-containing protein [Methylotenera sp.]MDO9392895.1 rhodanese-like domain-containing protein [Methylotenera sp.]MDP1523502.1 rhodanese-like domain-containing protein [Methylotenera sp.]MDP2071140.1 rhodanese-like domain-containing protein [Methylotenera sp.]MDP2230066.1 rhodanese-like domain-containing protein [Methylotenera sp.]